MRKLYDSDLERLAVILDAPLPIIQQLFALGLIDDTKALCLVIKKDYERMVALKMYPSASIIKAIASRYSLKQTEAKSIIKSGMTPLSLCPICGAVTARRMLRRYGGMCESCSAARAQSALNSLSTGSTLTKAGRFSSL